MKKKPKYKRGRKIGNMAHFEIHYKFDGWFFLNGKPKHPKILENMTYRTINGYINHGFLYEAQLNMEE
jgi:hypothetical protein